MLKKIYNKVTHEWDTSVEEALKSFIRLPALSPDFDKKWGYRIIPAPPRLPSPNRTVYIGSIIIVSNIIL